MSTDIGGVPRGGAASPRCLGERSLQVVALVSVSLRLAACGGGSNAVSDGAATDAAARDAAPDAPVDATKKGLFFPRVDFPTGTHPFGLAVADLNGDGKPDIAVVNLTDSTVSILLNATAGGAITPDFSPKVDVGTGGQGEWIAIDDLDGDGKPDLVIGPGGGVLINTTATNATTPTFVNAIAAGLIFSVDEDPTAGAVVDINGDGKPDIATENVLYNPGTISILLNTTTTGQAPSFSPQVVVTPLGEPCFWCLGVGDLNGDGKPDFAVASSILLNTTATQGSTPTFSVNSNDSGASANGYDAIAIGDLNHDGTADLVVARASGVISVVLNSTAAGAPTPSLSQKVDIPADAGLTSVAIGDLDRDGKPDLAVTSTGAQPGSVSVLLNTTTDGSTTPSFLPMIVDFPAALGARSIVIHDLNGDGKPDITVGNQDSNTVSVFIAQ